MSTATPTLEEVFGEPIFAYTADDAVEDGALIDLAPPAAPAERVLPLHLIESMDGYLQSYGKILGRKAINALTPLHLPGRDAPPDFAALLREPFPAQQHVIAATIAMLDTNGSGFIVGEMGTGKTLVGMSAVHYHAIRSRKKGGYGGKYRALVVCPDHLIGKWKRELEETLPDVIVHRFGPVAAEEVAISRKPKKGKAKSDPGTRLALRDTVALIGGETIVTRKRGDAPKGDDTAYSVSTSPNVFEDGKLVAEGESESRPLTPKPTSGTTVSHEKRWPKPEGAEWYVLGRNQAKWLSEWAGLAEVRPGMGGALPSKSPSARTRIVEGEPVTDELGRASFDSRGQIIKSKERVVVHVCPRCGSVATDKKGLPLAASELVHGKGKKQHRCLGSYLHQILPVGSQAVAQRICPVPAKHASREPNQEFTHEGLKWVLVKCNEPLFHYTSSPVRWSPARLIQKQLRGFLDYLIIDEVHEFKSDESAQSMACGKLMAAARHTIALTGTIIGGYADHLYPLMMRICGKSLREEGFEWGKDLAFSEVYGRIDRIITTKESDGDFSVSGNTKSMRRAKSSVSRTERKAVRPGVMPTMFGKHLIGSSMFITLEELADELPDLHEYVGGPMEDHWTPEMKDGWFDVACDMEPDQAAEYRRVAAIMEYVNKELLVKGSMKFLGAYLWTTMDYPDKPFGWGHADDVSKAHAKAMAEWRRTVKVGRDGRPESPPPALGHTVGYWDQPKDRKIENWRGVVTPKDMPEDRIFPKERKLIDICKKQKADGTQTWVYLNMTNKRDIQPRLQKLLQAEGLRVGILRAKDVEPIEREAWIAAHGREFDVVLSHPQLVSTGLDLFSKEEGGHNYSTLVFYETGYNLFTMRQAARRAWRISQPRDCRVYYLYYKETMQHKAMGLMSRKMAAAQALEGEFSEDGLAAMAGEDNLQMAMAKNLSERIDDADMQRNWGKVKSNGSKKPKPGQALKLMASPNLRAPAAMPPAKTLLGLNHTLRTAFKRLVKQDGWAAAKDFRCIPDTADGLVDAGLAERAAGQYRSHLPDDVVKRVLTLFQLHHADSRVHYPLGIVVARKPGGPDHYVRVTDFTATENTMQVLPVKGFPMVNSIPIHPKRAVAEGWVLVEASAEDKRALQARGFFADAKSSPLDGLPPELQLAIEAVIESQYQPVPEAAKAEFPKLAEEFARLDEAFLAATADGEEWRGDLDGEQDESDSGLGWDESWPEVETGDVKVHQPEPEATPEPEPEPVPDADDEMGDFQMPELTPEIMAKMFANLMQHGESDFAFAS